MRATDGGLDAGLAAAEATRGAIRVEGGRAEAIAAEIASAEDCQAAVDACVRAYGGLSKLHNNVGRSILAICIMPGYTGTPLVQPACQDERVRKINLRQVPMRRFGSPWDVARVAAFLASGEASYVTGVVMPVDGGLILHT